MILITPQNPQWTTWRGASWRFYHDPHSPWTKHGKSVDRPQQSSSCKLISKYCVIFNFMPFEKQVCLLPAELFTVTSIKTRDNQTFSQYCTIQTWVWFHHFFKLLTERIRIRYIKKPRDFIFQSLISLLRWVGVLDSWFGVCLRPCWCCTFSRRI